MNSYEISAPAGAKYLEFKIDGKVFRSKSVAMSDKAERFLRVCLEIGDFDTAYVWQAMKQLGLTEVKG